MLVLVCGPDVLQLRVTEAMYVVFDRRLVLGCFFFGAGLTGVEVTEAGLVTGALATGVGVGVGETGVRAGGAVETGFVLVGGAVDTGEVVVDVLAGGVVGVLAGGVVGAEASDAVPEPVHKAAAQHGSTTRSLLIGMAGPAMIQRLSGE